MIFIDIKWWLSSNFEMKDIGEASYVPDVKIIIDHATNTPKSVSGDVHQEMLERCYMHQCKLMDTLVERNIRLQNGKIKYPSTLFQ